MAYITGTVTSGQDLLNAIVTGMTDNGWTLHDTVNAADKVLYSTGTDGYVPMYIRVRNSYQKINYDAEVSAFTAGETIVGATSGAIGTIIEVTDNGSTGVLKVVDVLGAFVDNEIITSAGGSAVVNGVPQYDGKLTDIQNVDNQLNVVYFTAYSYWNSGTNTGTNERDIFGRYQVYPQPYVAATGMTELGAAPLFVYEQPDGTTRTDSEINFINYDDILERDQGSNTATLSDGAVRDLTYKMSTWDGYRRMVNLQYISATNSNTIVSFDLPTREVFTNRKLNGNISLAGYSSGPVFHRRSENRTYRLYYNSTGTNWRVVDIDTTDERVVTTNPFAATSVGTYGCRFAYDGNKYIYAIVGQSTEFRRLNLDTMTWSSLTAVSATPALTGSGHDGGYMLGVFVPANTVSGGGLWAEDRILFLITASTSLFAYNIGSNSWTTTAITLPSSAVNGSRIYFDGNYLHYNVQSEAIAYRIPAATMTGTWETVYRNAKYQLNNASTNGISCFAPRVSKVQYSVGTAFEYGILVSDDRIAVWTSPNDLYHWAYAGNYTKTHRTAIATSLDNYSIGSAVEMSVSDNTGFEVGDSVNILKTSTGVSFATKISAIGTGTITVLLTSSVSTGDLIFLGSADFAIAGDTDLAVCMYDKYGTYSTVYGNANALLNDGSSVRQPNRNTDITLMPINITWPYNTPGKFAHKGKLIGCYSVNGGGSTLISGSVVRDSNGNQYVVFMPHKRKLIGANPIAIGPIA